MPHNLYDMPCDTVMLLFQIQGEIEASLPALLKEQEGQQRPDPYA